MNNAQLIEEIRRNPLTRHLPIVVISAASHFDEKTRDPRVVWLHKPISTAQLLVALGKALND